MRRRLALLALAAATAASAQQPFTLQQILSAPYALALTAAPVGDQFAWVENAEGVRNIWLGSAKQTARQLTHYTQDDGQDIANLAWSPDATSIAYTYGAESGASGRPANPDEMHGQPLHLILQPLDPAKPAQDIGEGRQPLFMHGGCGLFFLRGGKIWARGFLPQPKLSSNVSTQTPHTPKPTLLCQTAEQGPFQLVTDRGSARSLTLSPDGNLLAYISHRAGHSFLALYDLNALILTFPAPSTGNDSAPAFSPDGKSLAWLREPATTAPEFAPNRTSPSPWSIQLATFENPDTHATHITTRTLYTPEPNKPGSVLPRFATGDPRVWWTGNDRLVFVSDAADGWMRLYALFPAMPSLPPIAMTLASQELEDISYNPALGRLLFATNFDGYDKLDRDRRHLMSYLISNGSVEELGEERLTAGAGIETHPAASGTQLAALISDDRQPMHISLITPDGKLADLPGVKLPKSYPTADLVTPQQVIIPSSDNLFQLHTQLFLPRNLDAHTKHPAILFFHGGPRRQMLLGYPAMDYYSNAYAFNQYLASRGYIVLSVNYRGGIGYGLNFRQCEHCGADGAAEYADVLAAQAYLAARPDVDAAHIGLWGGSYGGYLTALALARNSNLFAAGVDFHGVHEWALESNAPGDWLDHDPLQTSAQRDALLATAHASSPMSAIDHWRSPILLIHGDDDPEVAYAQTPVLADALRALKTPVPLDIEELIFPDEVHGFLLHKDWLAAYQAASDFFDRTLKPAPALK